LRDFVGLGMGPTRNETADSQGEPRLDADFGGTFRFTGSGAIDGVEVIRGRFYLASSDA